MTSPTKLTLAECKRRGWVAQVVERFNTYTNRRHDLFGCIDVVAIVPPRPGMAIDWDLVAWYTRNGPDSRALGIQCTTRAHLFDRSAKIIAEPRMKLWLEAGCRLSAWTWAKQGARGKRKLWRLKERDFTLDDFKRPENP